MATKHTHTHTQFLFNSPIFPELLQVRPVPHSKLLENVMAVRFTRWAFFVMPNNNVKVINRRHKINKTTTLDRMTHCRTGGVLWSMVLRSGVLRELHQHGPVTSLTRVNQQQCRQHAAHYHHHSLTETCTPQCHCTSHTHHHHLTCTTMSLYHHTSQYGT